MGAVDVRRGRQLQQDARDPGVPVELVQQRLDLLLRRGSRQLVGKALDPDLGAAALLVGDVDRRRRIVADEYRRQTGLAPAGRHPLLDLRPQLRPDLLGDLFAVNDRCAHRTNWYMMLKVSGTLATSASLRPDASLERVALACSLTPAQLLRALDAEQMPFALTGAWAGGGAIVGSDPLLVAGDDDDPF